MNLKMSQNNQVVANNLLNNASDQNSIKENAHHKNNIKKIVEIKIWNINYSFLNILYFPDHYNLPH